MKKNLLTLALALVASVVLTFTACGSKGTTTLAEWITTEEAKAAQEATNSLLASTGMSVTLAADGNTFVYEYHLPSGSDYSNATAEQIAAAFDPVIEQNKASVENLFTTFEESYGIKLDGARFTFISADGTELYSGDVPNN